MSAGSETRLRALDSVLDAALARSTADEGIVGKILGAVQGAPSASDIDRLAGDLFAVVDALESSVALRRAVTDPSTPEDGRKDLVHESLRQADLQDGGGHRRRRRHHAVGRWSDVRRGDRAASRSGHADPGRPRRDAGEHRGRAVPVRPDGRVQPGAARGDRRSRRSRWPTGRRWSATCSRAGPPTPRWCWPSGRCGPVSAPSPTRSKASSRSPPIRRTGWSRRSGWPGRSAPSSGIACRPALSKQVGRAIVIQEIVDPTVLGGIRVELGDEVIEGTVADRLEQARRLFG